MGLLPLPTTASTVAHIDILAQLATHFSRDSLPGKRLGILNLGSLLNMTSQVVETTFTNFAFHI